MTADEAARGTGEFRHAALMLYKGSPIAVGRNRFGARRLGSVHAECDLLRRAPRCLDWNHVRVFVVRVGADGERYRMSRPCGRCAKRLQRRGIKRVYWSVSD